MADRNDGGVKWIASYRVCIAFCGLYHVRIIKLEMHGGLSSAVRLLFETGAGFVNPCERGTSILWRERYRRVIVQSEPGLFESADLFMRETWEDWNALPLVAWVRKRADELTRFDGDEHDAAVYGVPFTHKRSSYSVHTLIIRGRAWRQNLPLLLIESLSACLQTIGKASARMAGIHVDRWCGVRAKVLPSDPRLGCRGRRGCL